MEEQEESIHEQMMRESDEEFMAYEEFYDEFLRNPRNKQEFEQWQQTAKK